MSEEDEVLVPGALYADCAVVVNLSVKLDNSDIQRMQMNDKVKKSGGVAETSMSTNKEKRGGKENEVVDYDDGEYGGELAGRLFWEANEAALKVWERENPGPVEELEEGIIGDRKEERNKGKQTQTNKNEHEVEKDLYL